MAIARNELCVREESDTASKIEATKWRVVSSFEWDVDISQCMSGCDVAILLGNVRLK